jgi:hypothetical protein
VPGCMSKEAPLFQLFLHSFLTSICRNVCVCLYERMVFMYVYKNVCVRLNVYLKSLCVYVNIYVDNMGMCVVRHFVCVYLNVCVYIQMYVPDCVSMHVFVDSDNIAYVVSLMYVHG